MPRVTKTITLSPEAVEMLAMLAKQQLRSSSHTIEALIYEAYKRSKQANHKAVTIQGV